MKWKKSEWERGSYSVEASLIMPIILFVIIALCYMAFYMHDKIRIQSIIDSAVLKAGLHLKHESDFNTGQIHYEQLGERGLFYIMSSHDGEEKERLETYIRETLRSGLMISEVDTIQVKVTGLSISVKMLVDVAFPYHKVRSYFAGNSKMGVSCRIIPHNPAEFIWGYTALDQVLSETKGYDAMKEKLGKLTNVIRQGI
jgi:Flp pilus assembly protein TadG